MITIQKAAIHDAEKLTEIMKRTFDEEARRWLADQERRDFNIQPPGYSSIEVTLYMMEELHYYKILDDKELVGGIIVTITGTSFGRIDRIFIDPDYQGRRIGTRVMELIEEEFSAVRIWDLETSSKQVNNHRFYEKTGYEINFKTEDEYSYIKRIERPLDSERLIENKDISNAQYENCHMEKTECYQVDLRESSFSNSSLMNIHISNCNLSRSKFQNINFTHSSFADLNLSKSKMRFVTLGGVRFLDTNLGENSEPLYFEGCDLQRTKIHNSNLRNLAITDCDLAGMTIDGVPVERLLEVYDQVAKK